MKLTVAKSDAATKIQNRIDKGKEIVSISISRSSELEEARNSFYSWNSFNAELLKKLFVEEDYANEYSRVGFGAVIDTDFAYEVKDFKDDVKEKIRRLESIVDRLELIDDPVNLSFQNLESKNHIFIVHGHDNNTRETVATFL